MRVILCLEFDNIENCNSDMADQVVQSITDDCERIKEYYQASDVYVMEVDDNDQPFEHGDFMIQKFYGAEYGWDNAREDGMLFNSRQEALETFFEDELIDGEDITTLSLPDDVRIVEIRS
jgi:hypothetical protein